jgi:hypothetical protein
MREKTSANYMGRVSETISKHSAYSAYISLRLNLASAIYGVGESFTAAKVETAGQATNRQDTQRS